MRLEIQNRKSKEVKDFGPVEKGLRDLRSYGKNTFAILTDADANYIQVAGGSMSCVVEMRGAGEDFPSRGYLSTSRVPFEGPQDFRFGGGKLIVNPEEFLSIDQVVDLFRCFFKGEPMPSWVSWRKIPVQ